MASQGASDVQSLTQKAETFWSEIKDLKIPDVTSGKTTDQIIEDIIEHEKVKTGIDWKAAAAAGPTEWKAATEKAHSYLTGLKDKLTEAEKERAKEMGLLNAQGELPGLTELFADAAQTTAKIPDGAAPFSVWGWKKERAKTFQDARGGKIKDKIVNLIRNFQVMKNDDARYITKKLMEMGMWGLGIFGLKRVWSIVTTLAELTEATEAFAVFEGVIEVGTAVINLAITVVILAVVVPLFIFMTKNAAGIMVIINDTDQDLVLEDLTCTHGKVVAIFKENAAEENPQPIIPKRLPPVINPETKEVIEGSIQAGFFGTRKRDAALIGTRGALKFEATESFPQGAYIGWSVPLSRGKNALLVSATFNGSVSKFSDNTGSHGKQEDTSTSTNNASITGRVNSGSGSEAYYIVNLSQ